MCERTKICSKCGAEKSLEEFNKDKSKKDGLFCWCKECHKQYNEEVVKEVLTLLGGQCSKCGDVRLINLSIHHKFDKKDKRYKKYRGGGCNLCVQIKKQLNLGTSVEEILKIFDVQCFSCHMSKAHKSTGKSPTAKRFQKIKEEVFDKMGNRCEECGDDDPGHLTLGHVDGGGCQEKLELGRIRKWRCWKWQRQIVSTSQK